MDSGASELRLGPWDETAEEELGWDEGSAPAGGHG